MARQKNEPREQEKSTAEYYKLNTRAIDDLVNADKDNSPEVGKDEIKKYGGKTRRRVSDWIKAILVKIWFAGVICYFFLWGLGTYIPSALDLWVVTAVALGFMTDLATNNILRLIEKSPGDNSRYMMFTQRKKFVTLPLNVLYACVLMALTVMTYALINRFFALSVGPILFGVIITAWDLLLIELKHLFQRILADAKAAAAHK